MTSDVQEVLLAALRLPAEARATLAAELIHSLDQAELDQAESDEGVEDAWADEIQHRLAAVDAGAVKPVPWSEARRRIFAAATGHGKAP